MRTIPAGRWAVGVVSVAMMMAMASTGWSSTLVEGSEELSQLCAFGAPRPMGVDDRRQVHAYHEQRRLMVHGLYETPLGQIDEEALSYDRVSGVLSMSTFREYRPDPDGPALTFRNPSLVRFEIDDEERAQDILTQLSLGTLELRVGYQLAARYDYEADFCVREGEGEEHLEVDLLYVRLTERGASSNEESIETYQSRIGYRQRLRQTMNMVDGARPTLPEVQISNIQWRREGQEWSDGPGDDTDRELLESINDELKPRIERVLYPCYVQVLSENPSLQGAIVIEVPTRGPTARPQVLMDTMAHPVIRRCVGDRVEEMDFPAYREEWEEVIEGLEAMKWTILLRRR